MYRSDHRQSTDKSKAQLFGFLGIPSFDQWVNHSKKKNYLKSNEIRTAESYLDSQMPVTLQMNEDILQVQTKTKFGTPQNSKISNKEAENIQKDIANDDNDPIKQQFTQNQPRVQIQDPALNNSQIEELRDSTMKTASKPYAVQKSSFPFAYQHEHSFQHINQKRNRNQLSQQIESPTFPQQANLEKPQLQLAKQSIAHPKKRYQFGALTPSKREYNSISNNQYKMSSAEKEQEKFFDHLFSNNEQSLWGQYGRLNWNSVQWKKIQQVFKISDIFFGVIDPVNLMSGLLGNCYFFSVISALAEKPNRIKKIFVTKEMTNQRKIVVKIYHKGIQRQVQLDEWIPCIGSRVAFTRSKENELWPIFLQKAWAKTYSSYRRIESGYPQEVLHDLTGAPIRKFCFKYPSFSRQQFWQYLIIASRNDYPMIVSSKNGSDRNKSQSDNLYGELFTVLSGTYLKFKGQSIKIVQMRNPWIKSETNPKGAWAKNDSNWQFVNQKERERIGFIKERQDGISFIKYQDFLNEFIFFIAAETIESYQYNHLTKKDRQCKGVFYQLQVLQQGHYNIQLNKTSQKCYANNSLAIRKISRKNIQFAYPVAKLQIGSYYNGILYKQNPVFSSSRERSLFASYDLKPGIYIIQVNVRFDHSVQEDFEVTLSTYSFYKCKLSFASFEQAVDISDNNEIDWH